MSLALDYLREWLQRSECNQADFAKACGMTGANVTDILNGDVTVSARNLAKLLRGLRSEPERLDFLSAYLRDQVPSDYSDEINIRLRVPNGPLGVMDAGDEEPLDLQMAQGFAALPSDLYRRRVVRFLNHLKKDSGLRDLFTRTVAYLEESDSK